MDHEATHLDEVMIEEEILNKAINKIMVAIKEKLRGQDIITEVTGAWFVFGWDSNVYPMGLFATEIEALRFMQKNPGSNVTFFEFGEWIPK